VRRTEAGADRNTELAKLLNPWRDQFFCRLKLLTISGLGADSWSQQCFFAPVSAVV